MRGLLGLLICGALAASASAQTTPQERARKAGQPAPPTAAQAALARAEGDAILNSAGAEAYFVNETGPNAAINLRHKASGLRCLLNPGRKDTIFRLLPTRGRPNEPGFECMTLTSRAYRLIAYYWAGGQTNEQLLAKATREILAGDRTAKPYHSTMAADMAAILPKLEVPGAFSAGSVALPAPPAARVSATFVTDSAVWHAVVGKLGDWGLEMRFSGRPSEKEAGFTWDLEWDRLVRDRTRRD